MPRRHDVKALSYLTATLLSESMRDRLKNHISSDCEFCKTNSEIEKCPKLLSLKIQIDETPIHARHMLHQGITKDRNDETLQMKYALSFVFEAENVKSDSVLVRTEEYFRYVRRYNDTFDTIRFGNENFSLDFIENILKCTNLNSLDLDKVQVTEDILETVGKNCTCIKILRGSTVTESNYTSMMFPKLLFADPETRLVKNNCCNTLESICKMLILNCNQCDFEGDTPRRQRIIKEVLKILISYVTALRSVEDFVGFRLDHVLEICAELEPRRVTKIREAHTKMLTVDKVEKLKKLCPDLRRLFIDGNAPNVEALTLLHTCSSITELYLCCFGSDTSFYQGILSTEWLTLKKLDLILGSIQILDINVIANVLKNLEYLGICSCQGVVWNGETSFQNLQDISLSYVPETGDADWFLSFAETIKSIVLESFTNIHLSSMPCLTHGYFPHLWSLTISPLAFDSEYVKDVVNNCHNLEYFGWFVKEDEQMVKDCMKYFEERNVNCLLNIDEY